MREFQLICYLLTNFFINSSVSQALDDSKYFFIDEGHSHIQFKVKYMGFGMDIGSFKSFKGLIFYDSTSGVSSTSVSLQIDMTSVNTGNEDEDEALKDIWFESHKYPFASFSSNKVERSATGILIWGELTIKGITKNIALTMNYVMGTAADIRKDVMIVFSGKASFRRSDFGVTLTNWEKIIGDEVEIELNVLGKQIKESNLSNRFKNPTLPATKIYQMITAEKETRSIFKEVDQLIKDSSIVNEIPLSNVGHMLILQGKYDKAIELLRYNLKYFSTGERTLQLLAESYLGKKDIATSINYYNILSKAYPGHPYPIELFKKINNRY